VRERSRRRRSWARCCAPDLLSEGAGVRERSTPVLADGAQLAKSEAAGVQGLGWRGAALLTCATRPLASKGSVGGVRDAEHHQFGSKFGD
jgi:hypothetical protein